jgi:hypothetical protein
MVDRASTFADDETLELLRKNYIAFAPSLTEILKSRDSAGDFFRKVANQRPEPKHSKQGYYICSPDGTLIKGWMYPRPDDGTMKRYLKEALAGYQSPKQVEKLDEIKVDRYANPHPPDGARVADVFTRLTDAKWQPTNLERFSLIRGALGRDRLWITRVEIQELAKGSIADSLLERLIRFHLVDNTRGVPAAWPRGDLKELQIKATRINGALRVEGSLLLEESNNRRYEAKIEGTIELKGEAISRFDLLVQGSHTARKADVGEIPLGAATLAVAFTLAEPGEGARVPPLYTWHGDYLKTDKLRVSELRKSSN